MTELCLASSRYIAFFDESGDHSLDKLNPEFPLFTLCTVIIEREEYARVIIPEVAEFKLRYFPHEGINLHSRDIRKSEGPFNILQNSTVRQQFMGELTQLVKTLPFALFSTVIDKKKHKSRYGVNAKNPYDIALVYTFERIIHFMESRGATDLPVIAEARGKNEDNALSATFYKFTTQGSEYVGAERFRKLICPLIFRKKFR